MLNLRFNIVFLCLLLGLMGFALSTHARESLPAIAAGTPYAEAKQQLLALGWQAVPNANIGDSSLYAQSLAEQGMPEVQDCISMALDGCIFQFRKQSRLLEVHTITRQLAVEHLQFVNQARQKN